MPTVKLMRVCVPALCVVLGLTARPAVAQDAASTLANLVARAEAVTLARAVRVGAGAPGEFQVTLRIEEVLAGTAAPTITLSEPDARGCGRALFAVATGQRFLACLRRQGEHLALCAAGARALPLATPAVVAHVRALIAAGDGQARVALLVAALGAADPRVRGDAALDLPLQPALGQTDAGQRTAIVDALRQALATQARELPSLITACVRLHEAAAIDLLLAPYLEGSGGRSQRLLATGLAQLDPPAVATAVVARLDRLNSAVARARAVDLLGAMDAEAARAPLQALAGRAPERGTRLRACAALLRGGVAAAQLREVADPELVELARQAARPQRPRFRSIDPE